MSILAKGKFVDKKMKLYSASEHEKNCMALLKQFASDNDGKDFFLCVYAKDEIDYNKHMIAYYKNIVLPALFVAMKEDYSLDSVAECDNCLSTMFLSKEKTKKDGNKYQMIQSISSISFAEQGMFLSKVANLAVSRYSIRFPNAGEINS